MYQNLIILCKGRLLRHIKHHPPRTLLLPFQNYRLLSRLREQSLTCLTCVLLLAAANLFGLGCADRRGEKGDHVGDAPVVKCYLVSREGGRADVMMLCNGTWIGWRVAEITRACLSYSLSSPLFKSMPYVDRCSRLQWQMRKRKRIVLAYVPDRYNAFVVLRSATRTNQG